MRFHSLCPLPRPASEAKCKPSIHIYFRKHKVLTELACLMFNSSNIQIYDITLFSEVLWMPHNQIFERLHCRHVSCVTSFRCWQIYLEAWRFQNRVKVVEALLTIANLDQNQSWHLRTFNKCWLCLGRCFILRIISCEADVSLTYSRFSPVSRMWAKSGDEQWILYQQQTGTQHQQRSEETTDSENRNTHSYLWHI